MPEKKTPMNPLLGKNIPPAPAIENGKTVSEDKSITAERQTAAAKPEEEKAIIELSLYLRTSQDDKLEDLRRAYKRRTGKKISANEVIRRLIEKATLETLIN